MWLPVPDDRPHRALARLIEASDKDDVFIVFCERRTDVNYLMKHLVSLPYPIHALHGGYEQSVRFRIMGDFRERKVKALVATDVAARGIDISHVSHVINLHVPSDVHGTTPTASVARGAPGVKVRPSRSWSRTRSAAGRRSNAACPTR